MTVRFSTGLRNALVGNVGFASIFNRGSINIYSGTQPVSADAAVTGVLLGTATLASGALTLETQASQTITVAGSAGSINTVTVGGLNIIPDGSVPFRVDAPTTASDLCDAINRNGMFTATVAAAVVTVKPRPGAGATFNGIALATTVTTLTATSGGNFAGGVAPVNGLYFSAPSAGTIARPSTSIWSFSGIAAGTAGWFRLVASANDPGAVVSGAPYYPRMDGSIATSGGDMALSNIAVAVNSPNTIDTFNFTYPAQ